MQQNACLRSFLARRFLSVSLTSPIKTALLIICSPLGQGVRLADKRTGICIYGSSLALKSYRSVSKCPRNAIFTVLGTPPQPIAIRLDNRTGVLRSEERRVGKECRYRVCQDHSKKNRE